MKRYLAIILVVMILVSLAACGSDSSLTTEETETTSSPSTVATTQPETTAAPELQTYPLNVESAYLDFAVSIPNIIYNTTGEENGLAGNIYIFEGTINKIETYTDDSGTYKYEDAQVITDGGVVTVTNIYKTIYQATVSEYGEAAAQYYYTDDVDNYVFPASQETAQFVAIYAGYSMRSNQPVFYLGASPSLYLIAELEDPVANASAPAEHNQSQDNQNNSASTDSQSDDSTNSTTQADNPTNATTQPNNTTTPTQATTTGVTVGEANALKSAKEYLRVMPFSYSGLIDQLEYEGYTTAEATYAVDNCGANWNEQALESAKDYLSVSAFSYTGLIDQLEYEGFTAAESAYGADNCNADWYEQAVKCAKSYLDYMSFSRDELIRQLEYEGFTHEQADYGAAQNGL